MERLARFFRWLEAPITPRRATIAAMVGTAIGTGILIAVVAIHLYRFYGL